MLNLQEPDFSKVLPDISAGKDNADRVFRDFDGQDILQPDAMKRYFEYYFHERKSVMSYTLSSSVFRKSSGLAFRQLPQSLYAKKQ